MWPKHGQIGQNKFVQCRCCRECIFHTENVILWASMHTGSWQGLQNSSSWEQEAVVSSHSTVKTLLVFCDLHLWPCATSAQWLLGSRRNRLSPSKLQMNFLCLRLLLFHVLWKSWTYRGISRPAAPPPSSLSSSLCFAICHGLFVDWLLRWEEEGRWWMNEDDGDENNNEGDSLRWWGWWAHTDTGFDIW